MADISQITGGLDALGLGVQSSDKQGEDLGQTEFFNLMIAQLQNQDPLEPLDSDDFLTQVAQFTQLAEIQNMSRSMDLLASSLQSSQALQASTLVGREVVVPGNRLVLDAPGDSASGTVVLPASSEDVNIYITDPAGAVVRTIELGSQRGGEIRFNWDGTDASGAAVTAGNYVVRASGVFDGETTSLETLVDTRVESVTLARGGRGMTLNLKGVGAMSLNDVRELL